MRTFQKSLIALAIASLFVVAPAAMAQPAGPSNPSCEGTTSCSIGVDYLDWQHSYTLNASAYVDITAYIYGDVQYYENVDINTDTQIRRVRMNKDLSFLTDVSITGNPTVSGDIKTDSAAIAVIDNRQQIGSNFGDNTLLSNDASIKGNVGENADGNIAFNVAAGDNNVQDNAAALAAADASFAFTMADAEVFVEQVGASNMTNNFGVTNTASLAGNALNSAVGNIGVNIAAGNNNAQKNSLAAATGTNSYAQATVSSNQTSAGNQVMNTGYMEQVLNTLDVSLSGSVGGSGKGGSVLGSYSGTSDQFANLYPDLWQSGTNTHPSGQLFGHADWDTNTQGTDINGNPIDRTGAIDPLDPNNDGGALVLNDQGELSLEQMAATLSGTISYAQTIVVLASNDASLAGNALQNATGNIGVNIAAGTGNMQANTLALAVTQAGSGNPPPGAEL